MGNFQQKTWKKPNMKLHQFKHTLDFPKELDRQILKDQVKHIHIERKFMQNFTGKFWLLVIAIAGIASMILMVAMCKPAHADTIFEWNRNIEIDLDHYEMYACNTSTVCVPGTTASDKIGNNINQPLIGIKPTMLIPIGTEGRAGVIAVDLVGNRSGLSNIVPFDAKGPVNPSGLLTK